MKKIIVILLTVSLSISTTISCIYALDKNENKDSIKLDKNAQYYDSLGNYDNPETGEYFHWNTKARGVRTFDFMVRNTLKGSYFKLGGTNVQIHLNKVSFKHDNGTIVSCCSSHKFSINLRRDGLSNNKVDCIAPTNGEVKFLGGGFSTSANYMLEIINHDRLPAYVYVSGSGSVNGYF